MSAAAGGDAGRATRSDQNPQLPPALPTLLVTGWPPYPAAAAPGLCRRAGLHFCWQRETPDGGWEAAGADLSYTPGSADEGRRLRLVGSRPGAAEPVICAESDPVRPGPGPCPAQRGQKLTEQPLGGEGFRLVTYNMLADYYVQYFREAKFDYYPAELYQDIGYRKQGLLVELLGYHADVLCLQEVDESLFSSYWQPMLEAAGFGGNFAIKRGPGDGLATFWSDKFRLVSTEQKVVAELAGSVGSPDVLRALELNAALKQSLTELPQVLQVTLLEEASPLADRPARRLLVANVHLFHDQRTEHLRALQVGLCLRYIQCRVQEMTGVEAGSGDVTLVFCGDFNSQPGRAVSQLMTTGSLAVQDVNTCAEQAVPGVTFSHGYRLASAYGAPEVTSCTSSFTGTLDHIFFMADRLQLQQVVPLPTPEEVRAAGPLPAPQFPSDHLALTADFHWIQ